jgi:hypothetical protein
MKFWSFVTSCAVVIGSAALLGACASPEELRAQDQQMCQGYGFTPGTDPFAKCMMTADQKRKDKDAQWLRDQQKKNEAMLAKPAVSQCKTTETTTTSGDSNNGSTTTNTSSTCVSD